MRETFWYLFGFWSAFVGYFAAGSLFEQSRDRQLMQQGLFWGTLLIGVIFFTVFRICIAVFGKKEPPK